MRPSLQQLMADTSRQPVSRWQPQQWRLRTKLIVLSALPMLLAVALGAIVVATAANKSNNSAIRDSIIIGAIVLLSLVLLFVLARSILKPLRTLRAAAFDVADRRLPAAIEQLRSADGRATDIRIEPVPVYSREDVGQVARAFDAVHSEAVRLASEQAALRANVNDMFVNLSRRSQSLVERQLNLIDELELGEQDADRLGSLFRLDHLATRMRRNSENLLVLAGAELRQRSGEPVSIVDVLRAAVGEIEDYQRVSLQPLPRAMVSGLAVNDIVHLVAELLDNATEYSDPQSKVRLSARFSDQGGLAVEIADSGAGLPAARLADINQRLTAPPAVDVSVSRQMGLFVVGRLANRHGIQVHLAAAESAGVTVTIAIPKELITAEGSTPGGRPDYIGRSHAEPAAAPRPVERGPENLFHQPQPPYADVGELFGSISEPNGMLDSPPAVNGNQIDTPIFHAMLSKWFTDRQDQPGTETVYTAEQRDPDDGWESEADAGWKAAEAASEPTAEEVTAVGLPKRRPQAFLVPGSAGGSTIADGQPAAAATRNPDAVRGRMASYQRGLTRGRHQRPNQNSQNGASGGAEQGAESENGHRDGRLAEGSNQ